MRNLFEDLLPQKEAKIFLNPALKSFPLKEFHAWWKTHEEFQNLFFFLSSGSESGIKIFGFTQEALLSSAQAVNDHVKSTQADSWLLALPTFHMGGFSLFTRAHLSQSKVYELNSNWDPLNYIKLAQEKSATLSSLVPAQLYDLIKLKISAPESLRAVFLGGAALDSNLLKEARNLAWPILPTYGMTECASQIATLETSFALSQDTHHPLKVLPIWQLKTDEQLKLEIHGSALFSVSLSFNLKTNEFEAQKRESSQAYTSQDSVELSSSHGNSYLKFLGRSDLTFKIGGEWVQLSRLQNILDSLIISKGLAPDFCLIAHPNERMGYEIAIVYEKSVRFEDLEQLENEFNEQVMGFEKIRKKLLIDRIPRTSLSKISYTELRKALGIA
ncbi:MAG: AMP-binding protein [Proteobacteria bacterium]|nr:AMP-binding protein [Pseudomonadota bacterium]